MSHAQASAIILAGRGSHFDPDLVDAFALLQDNFHAVAVNYVDDDETLARLEAQNRHAIGLSQSPTAVDTNTQPIESGPNFHAAELT